MSLPVLIYHSEIATDAPADELDVLDQVEWFTKGLQQMHYNVLSKPFILNIASINSLIRDVKPIFIVNLVETICASGRLIYLAPALFEHFQIPFTGCCSESIYLTSNKILAKEIMNYNSIPTPSWLAVNSYCSENYEVGKQYIIKSSWEHASAGMDEHELTLYPGKDSAIKELKRRCSDRMEFFGEEYLKFRHFLVPNSFVYVRAFVKEGWENKDTGGKGDPRIQFNNFQLLHDVMDSYAKKLSVHFHIDEVSAQRINALESLFKLHTGNHALNFVVTDESEKIRMNLPSRKLKVKISQELLYELDSELISYRLN